MAITGGDIVWAGEQADKWYNQEGFSSTIRDSFSAPSTRPWGAHFDGTDLYGTDIGQTDAYHFSGFSSTLNSSVNTVAEPCDCTFDSSSNLIYARQFGATDKIMKTSGFSTTVSDSYASADTNPSGCGWDGTNVIEGGVGSDKMREYSGFSSTVNDSYVSKTNPNGAESDETDTFVCNSNGGSSKHVQYSGFSSTISDSYGISSIDNAPNGLGIYVSTGTAYTQDVDETATLVDSISNMAGKAVDETVTLVDSFNKSVTAFLTDTVVLVDTLATATVFTKSLTDVITLAESVASQITAKILSEIMTLVDTISTATSFGKSISEVVTLVDTSTNVKMMYRSLTEVVTLVDSYATVFVAGRTLIESFTIGDRLVGLLNGVNMKWSDQYADEIGTWVDQYFDF